MPLDDPSTWAQGASALKGMIEGFRSAVGLVKEIRDQLGGVADPTQRKALDEALESAERGALIAEAEIAKALGYELCRCEFPPTPMRTVGNIDIPAVKMRGQVYECPKCGFNTAGPYVYQRIAPPRQPSGPAA